MISAADAAVQWAADHAARRRRSAARRRVRAQVLVALVSAWVLVPRTLQSLLEPKYWLPAGSDRSYATPAAVAVDLLLLAVLGWAALMIMEAVADPPPGRRLELAAALAPWLWIVGVDQVRGAGFSVSDLVYPLVIIAGWTLRPTGEVVGSLGWMLLGVVLVSLWLGLLAPDRGLWIGADGAPLGTDKALVASTVLVGIFSQGNNYGQFVLLGLPFLLLLRRRPLIIVGVGLAAFSVVWSAARTSLVGLFTVAVVVTVLIIADRRLPPRIARLVAGLSAALPLVAVAALPIMTRDPETLTRRGWIWLQSLRVWRIDHPVAGLGSDWYARTATTTERLGDAVFHAHNEFVQLLVTGGIVLAVLVAVLAALAVRAATRQVGVLRVLWVAWLVALAMASLAEVSLPFVDNQSMVPVVALPLALLLFGPAPAAGQATRSARSERSTTLS